MAVPAYLFRHSSGIYYFRWVVPPDLRANALGRNAQHPPELRRSLHTRDKRSALVRALRELGKRIGQIVRGKSDHRMWQRRAHLALMYAQSRLDVASDAKQHSTIREVTANEAESQLKTVDKESSRVDLGNEVTKEASRVHNSTKRLLAAFEMTVRRHTASAAHGSAASVFGWSGRSTPSRSGWSRCAGWLAATLIVALPQAVQAGAYAGANQRADGDFDTCIFATDLIAQAFSAVEGADATTSRERVNVTDPARPVAVNEALGRGSRDQLNRGQLSQLEFSGFVRLVRSQGRRFHNPTRQLMTHIAPLLRALACTLLFAGTPATTWSADTQHRFTLSRLGDAVYDRYIGAVWYRCSYGQNWEGNACVGTPLRANSSVLTQVLAEANAHGWELPTKSQLLALFDSTTHTVLRIDTNTFPETPGGSYWTKEAFELWQSRQPTAFFTVNFYNGYVQESAVSGYYVRLVLNPGSPLAVAAGITAH